MPSGYPATGSHVPWASEVRLPFAVGRGGGGWAHAGLRWLCTHRWTARRFPLAGSGFNYQHHALFLWVCAPFNCQVSCCA